MIVRLGAAFLAVLLLASPLRAQTAVQLGMYRGVSPEQLCVFNDSNVCVSFISFPTVGPPLIATQAFAPSQLYISMSPGTGTGTSSRATLPAGTDIVVYNTGAVPAYVALGTAGALPTATTTNDVVFPGCWIELDASVNSWTRIAAVTASSTTTLVVSGGSGLGAGGCGGGSGGGGVSGNITEWASTNLGTPSTWGTAPTGQTVIGVNADILGTLPAFAAPPHVVVDSLPTPVSVQAAASSFADGFNPTLGSTTDTACANGGLTCSDTAVQKGILTAAQSPIPPQANTTSVVNIGNVGQTNGDPCSTQTHSHATISVASNANTKIITGTAAKQTYICHLELFTAIANNVALVEGSGSVCASSTLGMSGGATAANGWNFIANQGFVSGAGSNYTTATTVAANDVCLFVSSGGPLAGAVVYVQQ